MRLRALLIAVVASAAESATNERNDLYGKVQRTAGHDCTHRDVQTSDPRGEEEFSSRFVRASAEATEFYCPGCCMSDFWDIVVDYPTQARLEDALGRSPDWDNEDVCIVGRQAVTGRINAGDCREYGGRWRPARTRFRAGA